MLNMVFAAKIGREVYFHDLIDRQCKLGYDDPQELAEWTVTSPISNLC